MLRKIWAPSGVRSVTAMSPLALSIRFLQAQPDGRLTQLAREGHEPAFEALVRRYRNELLSYCRRLTPEAANAEDALQQALLQAWRALKAGAEVRDIKPWLYRIAHNVSISHLRAGGPPLWEIQDAPGRLDVDQVVQHRLQARAALAGMASLPELQRQAFVSTTLDGASHEEVATALGLSNGSVRGLIYRARAALRAAAAAVIPSPALTWAIRHAETRTRRTSGMLETTVGGAGAGMAGLVAKGGAVLAVAGAVAGGGMIGSRLTPHHRHSEVGQGHRASGSAISAHLLADRARDAMGNGSTNATKPASPPRGGSNTRSRRGDDGSSRNGPDGATTSGRDGSSSSRSDGGSREGGGRDEGSSLATIAASSGATGGTGSGDARGSSGSGSGDSGSSGGPGPDGGVSSGQVTFAATASGGTSGSDGVSSGSSGSGDTTTTAGTH